MAVYITQFTVVGVLFFRIQGEETTVMMDVMVCGDGCDGDGVWDGSLDVMVCGGCDGDGVW